VAEGIQQYEQAWAAEPDQAETAVALGNAFARVPTRANLEQARSWLQRAVALSPDTASYRVSLGRVLEQLGRASEAREAYLQALDRDASLSSAASSLVRLAQGMNEPAVARLFGRVVRVMDDGKRADDAARRRLWDHPDDPEAQLAVAQRLAGAGEFVKADNHLQQALQRKPGWPAAQSLQRAVEALRVWSGSQAAIP
jgi:Flp pilus assembly protein TadD